MNVVMSFLKVFEGLGKLFSSGQSTFQLLCGQGTLFTVIMMFCWRARMQRIMGSAASLRILQELPDGSPLYSMQKSHSNARINQGLRTF